MPNFYLTNLHGDLVSGHETFEEAQTLGDRMVNDPEFTRGLMIVQVLHVWNVENVITEKKVTSESRADPAVVKEKPIKEDKND